jgi:hypothetical protein
LSRRFKDVPSVTIAMMNTDENTPFVAGHRNGEVLDEIDRVPTLLLYAAHPGKGGPEWSFGDYVVGCPPLSRPHPPLITAHHRCPRPPPHIHSSPSVGRSMRRNVRDPSESPDTRYRPGPKECLLNGQVHDSDVLGGNGPQVEAPENMDRSLSGLTKWILTHAQTQFQLPQEEREEGF